MLFPLGQKVIRDGRILLPQHAIRGHLLDVVLRLIPLALVQGECTVLGSPACMGKE